MTRNVPGAPPQEGYYSGPQENYPQPPPNDQRQYGSYASQEGNQGYNQYQQSGYAENKGQAQSYYGSNEQPYQQYPPEQSWNLSSGQYTHGGQHAPQTTSGEQNYAPPQYGSEQYHSSGPERPQYAEGYNQEAQQYIHPLSSEVDAFKSHFDQSPAPHTQHSPPTGQYPAGSEEDRGIMGALAGGAAGAYGGHKVHHGFLGGVGGAIGGSMLEDAAKKHHKKEEAEKHRHHDHAPGHHHHSHNSGGNNSYVGNFSHSSRAVRLEDRCTLVADCLNMGGHHQTSRLDLNDCLTNTDGRLFWAKGGNFAASARHIRLTENGSALEAELGDGRGGWASNRIYLNERITNEDGRLAFLHT